MVPSWIILLPLFLVIINVQEFILTPYFLTLTAFFLCMFYPLAKLSFVYFWRQCKWTAYFPICFFCSLVLCWEIILLRSSVHRIFNFLKKITTFKCIFDYFDKYSHHHNMEHFCHLQSFLMPFLHPLAPGNCWIAFYYCNFLF